MNERSNLMRRPGTLPFGSADDQLRALRWSLSLIRRAFGEDGSIPGSVERFRHWRTVSIMAAEAGSRFDPDLFQQFRQAVLEGAIADLALPGPSLGDVSALG
jgi:hypothetical protein